MNDRKGTRDNSTDKSGNAVTPKPIHRYLIAGARATGKAQPEPVIVHPAGFLLKVDPSKCTACGTCEMACSLRHEGAVIPSLARLHVNYDPFSSEYPSLQVCRHCMGPECLLACPAGAIHVDPDTGARIVDEQKCIGCGLCEKACLLGMVRLNPATQKSIKCDLCHGNPQCVRSCPQNAITFEKTKRGY